MFGEKSMFHESWDRKRDHEINLPNSQNVSQQQSAEEKIYFNPYTKLDIGHHDTTELSTKKILRLGFMLADFRVVNTPCEELQVIQVCYFIPNPKLQKQYGKELIVEKEKYRGFVDGGRNSPDVLKGGEQGHMTKPYFYGPTMSNDKKIHERWNGQTGNVIMSDEPFAAFNYVDIRFETYVVAANYKSSKLDKILGYFKWGFSNFGTVALHTKEISFSKTNSLSTIAKEIIKNDGYSYQTTI